MAKKGMAVPGINRSTKLIKKRRKKNRVLKSIVDYLRSDSYMYEPMVSSQMICSPPISETRYETEKSVETDKSLLKKIVEYLKSDSFMYAPLFSHPLPDDEAAVSSSLEAPTWLSKRVPTKEVVATAEIAKKVHQPVNKTVDGFGAHELWNNYAFERSSVLRSTRGTKKRVFQNK